MLFLQQKDENMKKYIDVLKKCILFKDLSQEQITAFLDTLNTKIQIYKKNEYIYYEGQEIESIGIILHGNVQIITTDYFGNDSIYAAMTDSDMFGEALFAIENKKMPFSIVASSDSEILFIKKDRLFGEDAQADASSIIIKNLICILAEKTLKFRQTIEHVTRRTTRQKVLSYLMYTAKTAGTDTFTIPFNRQQLADYLAVERSALSAELSRMQNDGLIDYHKNIFTLKHK